jgi:hypothetical protein
MRHIALVLAPALALATAQAAETVAPPIKIAVFPFELEDFSAGAGYVPQMTSTVSSCGFRPRKPVG